MRLFRHPALTFWAFVAVIATALVITALALGSGTPRPVTVSSPARATQLVGEWHAVSDDLARLTADGSPTAGEVAQWAADALAVADAGYRDAVVRTGASSMFAATWSRARDVARAVAADPTQGAARRGEVSAIGDDLTRRLVDVPSREV